jgi:hypothetical protein
VQIEGGDAVVQPNPPVVPRGLAVVQLDLAVVEPVLVAVALVRCGGFSVDLGWSSWIGGSRAGSVAGMQDEPVSTAAGFPAC